jgi:hypothetical protein
MKKFASRAELHWSPDGGAQQYLGDVYGVKLRFTNSAKEVITFEADGVAGYTDGIVRTELTFDRAVPKDKDNSLILKALIKNQDVQFIVRRDDGLRLALDMRIMELDEDFSLEKASNQNCKANGGKPTILNDGLVRGV